MAAASSAAPEQQSEPQPAAKEAGGDRVKGDADDRDRKRDKKDRRRSRSFIPNVCSQSSGSESEM